MPKQNFQVTNVASTKIPNDMTPKGSWGTRFSRDSGFAFKLPYDNRAAVFLDKRLTSGNHEQAREVFSHGGIAARIITCEGKEWRVSVEPIQKGKCGITVLTGGDKPIMAGQARFSGNGEMSFSVRTLYPKISASPKKTTAKVEGTGKSDGTWQVTGSVSVEF